MARNGGLQLPGVAGGERPEGPPDVATIGHTRDTDGAADARVADRAGGRMRLWHPSPYRPIRSSRFQPRSASKRGAAGHHRHPSPANLDYRFINSAEVFGLVSGRGTRS